jgi:hypothetical protein
VIRIESLGVNGGTTRDRSISINDDNGQMTNKKTDDEDNNDKKLYKSSSDINDNSKNTNLVHEQTNKTSNSNVFSRIIHSEPHVQKKAYTYQQKTPVAYYQFIFFFILLLLSSRLFNI